MNTKILSAMDSGPHRCPNAYGWASRTAGPRVRLGLGDGLRARHGMFEMLELVSEVVVQAGASRGQNAHRGTREQVRAQEAEGETAGRTGQRVR
nr:hypothetical protein [Candidatus Frankia nodulisporulans]